MKNTYKIIWSDEALESLRAIIEYLEYRWTRKEISQFSQLLDHQLELIQNNPYLFPKSENSNELRKAVLSRQTSIFYQIEGAKIHIVSIFDNRQHPNRLSQND